MGYVLYACHFGLRWKYILLAHSSDFISMVQHPSAIVKDPETPLSRPPAHQR